MPEAYNFHLKNNHKSIKMQNSIKNRRKRKKSFTEQHILMPDDMQEGPPSTSLNDSKVYPTESPTGTRNPSPGPSIEAITPKSPQQADDERRGSSTPAWEPKK